MTPSEVVKQHVNQYSQHHQLREHESHLLHVGRTRKIQVKKWEKISEVETLYNLITATTTETTGPIPSFHIK